MSKHVQIMSTLLVTSQGCRHFLHKCRHFLHKCRHFLPNVDCCILSIQCGPLMIFAPQKCRHFNGHSTQMSTLLPLAPPLGYGIDLVNLEPPGCSRHFLQRVSTHLVKKCRHLCREGFVKVSRATFRSERQGN